MKPHLKKIPTTPGVYFFLDSKGKIIYIGKAKNLRSRIGSYWSKSSELSPAKRDMIRLTKNIDFTIVSTETEALLLEAGLIRKHMPRFNIVLRDDKSWTYIVITEEPFPRIITTHGRKRAKGKHFGPYTSAAAAKTMVRFLHRLLPIRTCKRDLSHLPKGKVCIQYQLGRCEGPCEEFVRRSEYDLHIERAESILKGKGQDMYRELQHKMKQASADHKFELAANLRDKIKAWQKIMQPQAVVGTTEVDQDIIGLINQELETVVTFLQMRRGQTLDKFSYLIARPLDQTHEETLEQALAQHYRTPSQLPQKILLPVKPRATWKKLLHPASVLYPERGKGKKLLSLAEQNAWSYFQRIKSQPTVPKNVFDLKEVLDLKQLPRRIETYDISNIQGNWNVGSMVVFENGVKKPSAYKKFKIRTITGADDVHAMKEMLTRRQQHPEWGEPDLLVLDGGKPQLNTVYPILKESWQSKVISLAKKQEEIFLPKKKNSLKLAKSQPASLLLQAGRNEAHRTAIRYYRLLHKKSIQ